MNETVSCYKKYTFKSKTIYSLDVVAAAGIIASIVFIIWGVRYVRIESINQFCYIFGTYC